MAERTHNVDACHKGQNDHRKAESQSGRVATLAAKATDVANEQLRLRPQNYSLHGTPPESTVRTQMYQGNMACVPRGSNPVDSPEDRSPPQPAFLY